MKQGRVHILLLVTVFATAKAAAVPEQSKCLSCLEAMQPDDAGPHHIQSAIYIENTFADAHNQSCSFHNFISELHMQLQS
jgi:hypothetical protein